MFWAIRISALSMIGNAAISKNGRVPNRGMNPNLMIGNAAISENGRNRRNRNLGTSLNPDLVLKPNQSRNQNQGGDLVPTSIQPISME